MRCVRKKTCRRESFVERLSRCGTWEMSASAVKRASARVAMVVLYILLVGRFHASIPGRFRNRLQDIRWKDRKESIAATPNLDRFYNQIGYIDMNDTLFLHLGKAGGGSVWERMKAWQALFPKCHPKPCPIRLRHSNLTLVNVRDPVDRFVSAFNWRSLVLCRPQNETRLQGMAEAVKHPDLFCKSIYPWESTMIHEQYKSNVNMLAEALCDHGITGEKVRKDLKRIMHAKHFLSDWLPNRSVHTANLIAVVMEPGFDFIQQIDSALKWVVGQRIGEVNAAWLEEKASIQNNIVPNESKHSSVRPGYHPPPLSPLGTCCLTRHLAKDYDLLWKLRKKACRGSESCQKALQSILDRRKKWLAKNFSCRQLTGN